MCHGDVSMTYWWNKTYTLTTKDGKEVYSDHYLSMSPQERAKGSYVNWDIEHKCREIQPIEDWVDERRLVPLNSSAPARS